MKRFLFAALMTLTVTAVLLAQRGPGGPQRDPGTALKDSLNLTDAQVAAITALAQTERTKVQAIMSEIDQKRQTLDTLLSAALPSAVDVGNAAIALHASENKLQVEKALFISQIKQQLTGEQQQKLDTLLAANGGRGLPIPGLGEPSGRGRRGR